MNQAFSKGVGQYQWVGAAAANPIIIALLLPTVFYNGVLAIINNFVTPLSFSHAAIVEMLILLACMVFILAKGIFSRDAPALLFLGFNLIIAVYMSVLNGAVFVDFFRSALIIAIFCIMGTWANEKTIIWLFRIAVLTVLGILFLELASTEIYGDIFNPAAYFENTRGLEQISFDGSKLFQNAQKLPGRFSFGIADHRTSSVFLEQVSLANFSGVLIIYLMSMFGRLGVFDRVLMLFSIVLIITTNDTRTMVAFSIICLIGYHIFPRLNTPLTALIMPVVLLAGFALYLVVPNAEGDTIPGRVVLTINNLLLIDFKSLMGLNIEVLGALADSGYVYVILAATIFGFLALWLYVSFYPDGETAAQRRAAYSLSIFFFMNMMIGGNAVFTIKIAALLWLLIGFMKVSEGGRSSRQAVPFPTST